MIHGFCAASIFHKFSGIFPLLDKRSDLSWACPRLKILPGGLGVVQRPGSRKRRAGIKGPRFDSRRDASCTWWWWWRWWQWRLWKQVLVEAQYQVSWGDNDGKLIKTRASAISPFCRTEWKPEADSQGGRGVRHVDIPLMRWWCAWGGS